MAGERRESWYVKASFGAEWGPMSADTLLEMADNGDLARDDFARVDANIDAIENQPRSIALAQFDSF